MKSFKLLSLFFIFLFLISCDKEETGKELFIQANQSSLKINDATFTAKYTFRTKEDVQNASININIIRDKDSKLGFIVKFDTQTGTGLYDGKKYYYIDNKNKKFYTSGEEIEAENFILSSWISYAIQLVMLDQDYTEIIKERNDKMIILDKNATIGTLKTTVVETTLPINENKVIETITTWFDNETNIPVRETRKQTRDEETISTTFEISNFKINQGIDKSLFTLSAPQGYTSEIITPKSEPEGDKVGEMAEDFSLKDLENNVITLSKLRGNVVVLDFWGTWCKWCVKAMPKIQSVHEHFKGKKVIVLGISCKEPNDADPKQFMKEHNITYNSLKYGEEITHLYNVTGFPTLFVIDKDGKIIKSLSGYSDDMDTQLINIIEKNL